MSTKPTEDERAQFASQYTEYYCIAQQGEEESGSQFCSRVAGELRDKGRLIEAHEVSRGARHDDDENVVAGLKGAIGMALQGLNFGGGGKRLVEDEQLAGVILETAPPDMSSTAVMMSLLLSEAARR